MIDGTLAFLDSGIGGLPYLEWIARRRPDLPLSYIADSAHFPYGELDPAELKAVAVETARRIFRHGTPRLLTVACNTASVAALTEIRAEAPCPVVGTVPAVKPAASHSPSGAIGVIATKGTVHSPYLDRLVDAFAGDRRVIRVAAGDIVRFVEERWLDEGDTGAVPVVKPALDRLKEHGVASLVVGCTHFLHVMEPIRAIMGPGTMLVDSRDGVGRRILSLLGEDAECPPGTPAAPGWFYTTEDSGNDRYNRFAALHGLEFAGVLP